MDQGTSLGNVFKGSSLNPELSDVFFFSFDGNSVSSNDFSNDSFTDEIFDFDAFVVGGDEDVDGEMVISLSHSEFVAYSDTSDHVSYVGDNGSDGTFLLSGTEPH
jgi:hypothetical protein